MATKVKPDKRVIVKICFQAQGVLTQDAVITDPKVSIKKLQAGLNSGKYLTTIHTPGIIEETSTGKQVAIITDTNNELSYEEFEVTEAE